MIRSSLRHLFACVLVFGAAITIARWYRTPAGKPVTIGCTAVLGYWLINKLNGRSSHSKLASLMKHTSIAARGDYSHRVQYTQRDEFTGLAVDINRILKRWEDTTQQITDLNGRVLDYQVEIERERSYREEQLAKRSRDLLEKTEIATKDPLTGLHNRRECMERFHQMWNAKNLHAHPLACIILDIDHFKSFNDTYSHAVGDTVLQEVAAVLRENVRPTDVVCRVGGEEFVVLCPQGGMDGANICAERLRAAVAAHVYEHDSLQLHVTISLGVAERSDSMNGPDDLLNLADERLNCAKRSGRNRVISSSDAGAMSANNATMPARSTVQHFQSQVPAQENGSIRILMAVQDETLRQSWTTALSASAIEVIELSGQQDIFSTAQQSQIDVIVIEGESPAASVESIKALNSDPLTAEIPVLLVTTQGESTADQSAIQDEVDDLLFKPVDASIVAHRVSALGKGYRIRMAMLRQIRVHNEHELGYFRLCSYSQSLSQCITAEEVVEKSMPIASNLVQCGSVFLMLADTQLDNAIIARGPGSEEAEPSEAILETRGIIARRVIQSGQPIVLNTADEAQRLNLSNDATGAVEIPIACYPLSAHSQTVGALGVTRRVHAGPFDAKEIEYLMHMAGMAASAVAEIMSSKSRDDARDSVVEALAGLAEYRDDNTGQHLTRVTQYSLLLAATLRTMNEFKNQIDDQFMNDLVRAVPLHDIGKVGIPDKILLKNRKLTREEMTIMKQHVDIGVDTIESVRKRVPGATYLKMACDIAAGHHEWYNGEGYPKGLRGNKIPLAARIVALSDVYDALTTERPYKPAYRHADAAQVIYQSSSIQFDPSVVEAFRKQEQQFAKLADALSDRKPRAYAEPGKQVSDAPIDQYELAPLD